MIDAGGAIRGDVVLDDTLGAVSFAFDVGVNQSRTYSGDISGTGDVRKVNEGTLTLLGSNSFDGTLFLDEGTLIGNADSLPGYIEASAFDDDTMLYLDTTLIFDQSSADSFDGDIWDNGDATNGLSLEKRGAGTLTLSGDIAAFRGTILSEGRLIVDGFLDTRGMSVGAGTVLGGGGSISGGMVAVKGTLSPGSVDPGSVSQIGSLEVENIDFQPGSVFEVDVDDFGADNLDVIGGASLGSENILRVIPANGTYALPTRHLILGASSLDGSFTFETDFFRLDVWCGDIGSPQTGTCASTDGQNLFLWIDSNDLPWASAATTPNQLTVGQVLDAEEGVAGGPTGDLLTVFQALQVIPEEQVLAMLDAVGGEPLSAFPTAQLAMGERFNRALHRRMRDAAWGKPDALYAPGAVEPAPPPMANEPAAPSTRRARHPGHGGYGSPFRGFEGNTGIGVWLDGWGSLGELDGDGDAADLETRSFGGTLGFDYRLGERVSLGLAGGYGSADIELDGRASQGDVDLVQGALYAGYVDPRFHVTGSGRYGHAWNDSERSLVFSRIDRKAKASFDSQDYGARAEIGANALRYGPLHVAPLAAFDWAQLRREDFEESGADSLDLLVEEEEFTSLLSSLGGSLRGTFDLGDDVGMVVELRGFWLHEFGDVERPIRARLRGGVVPGSFEILGAELPRDRILAGLGWSASIEDVVRVFADYDVGIGSGLLQHELTLAVRIHF
jgi:outer membrane autotransporter protein